MQNEQENTSNSPVKPYNEMAFEEFIEAIGNDSVENWSVLAEVLGVDRKTIWAWKQHPKAQKAIRDAIRRNMSEMVKVGADDWRMHREMLKIYGVKDKSSVEHEVGESVTEVLDQLERSDYDKFGRQAKGQMVENEPSVQNQE